MDDLIEKWITSSLGEISMVLVSAVATYFAILCYTRIAGLRSFSKMSASDFAITVAVGSLFASTISTGNPSLIAGLVALGTLFAGQWTVATIRHKSAAFSKLIDNKPLLLMAGSKIIDANLQLARVTRQDLYGKLREANAFNYDQILAVVFETTGDVSVIHSDNANNTLESDFFLDVIGHEHLFES